MSKTIGSKNRNKNRKFKKKQRMNRKYKDTVFRMLFGKDKKALLSLYNAVNGTSYTDEESLEINTLENAIYVGFYNDVSCIFHDDLNLYEHQSTLNPNLPLRDLFYVAELLTEYTGMRKDFELFSSKRQEIPTPRFVVFYNGQESLSKEEYRLSDLFKKKEDHPQLELAVRVVNVNNGEQNDVMRNCRILREYADFVSTVRRYLENEADKEEAMRKALDDCVARGILKEFLLRNRVRVMKASLYEYDAEHQRKVDRQDGFEEGYGKGHSEGYGKGRSEKIDDYEKRLAENAQRLVEKEREIEMLRKRLGEI